jgi:hypothetical protein
MLTTHPLSKKESQMATVLKTSKSSKKVVKVTKKNLPAVPDSDPVVSPSKVSGKSKTTSTSTNAKPAIVKKEKKTAEPKTEKKITLLYGLKTAEYAPS